MRISYHRNFKKALRKQKQKVQNKFWDKLEVFAEDQFHYSLNNHALVGKFKGTRSIDITGDVRVHYEEESSGIILLDIDTHSQLY
ncbi:MAG: type II toxin-antitoxin system mRNA interferase toxin, RelE/StbE family [bacterium]|nr:type II toxin-antitoxin system mRNA interferase toxin, RelE/StbE family [bacterium]